MFNSKDELLQQWCHQPKMIETLNVHCINRITEIITFTKLLFLVLQ